MMSEALGKMVLELVFRLGIRICGGQPEIFKLGLGMLHRSSPGPGMYRENGMNSTLLCIVPNFLEKPQKQEYYISESLYVWYLIRSEMRFAAVSYTYII